MSALKLFSEAGPCGHVSFSSISARVFTLQILIIFFIRRLHQRTQSCLFSRVSIQTRTILCCFRCRGVLTTALRYVCIRSLFKKAVFVLFCGQDSSLIRARNARQRSRAKRKKKTRRNDAARSSSCPRHFGGDR